MRKLKLPQKVYCLALSSVSKKVTYSKQITHQHLCHKNFGQGLGVVEPVKIFLSSVDHLQNLVAAYYTVWGHVGCAKIGVDGAPVTWDTDRA